jgi:hypothetical protein
VLKQEHEGRNYSTKRALFHIQDFRPGGKGIGLDWQFTIIFKTELFPHLKEKMKDSPREPVVIDNGWGGHAAINKDATRWLASNNVVNASQSAEDHVREYSDASDLFPPSPPVLEPTLESALQEIISYAGSPDSPIPFKEREYKNVLFALFSTDDLQAAYEEVDWQAELKAVIAETKILPEGMRAVQGTSGIYLGVRITNSITNGESQ